MAIVEEALRFSNMYCPKCFSSYVLHYHYDYWCEDCKFEGYNYEYLNKEEMTIKSRSIKLKKLKNEY